MSNAFLLKRPFRYFTDYVSPLGWMKCQEYAVYSSFHPVSHRTFRLSYGIGQ